MTDVEGRRQMAERNSELLRGTVELLILTALSRGRHHGFGIARWLEAISNEELKLEEGSLYPALHRMERRGWLESEWGISENKRQVKLYRLTRRGRARLRMETEGWVAFTAAVGKVLEAGAVG